MPTLRMQSLEPARRPNGHHLGCLANCRLQWPCEPLQQEEKHMFTLRKLNPAASRLISRVSNSSMTRWLSKGAIATLWSSNLAVLVVLLPVSSAATLIFPGVQRIVRPTPSLAQGKTSASRVNVASPAQVDAPLTKLSALSAQSGPDVQVLLNGAPAAVGTYTFPFPAGSSGLVLDNGLVRFTFNGKSSTSKTMLALSIVANGQELAPLDGQNSFYVDASGGTPTLVCSQVKVLRNSPDLAEVAFVDTTTATLRPEHHLIMRRGKPGLYGYVIETANSAFTISELRVVARWNRTLLDHVFNWERGGPDAPGTALNGQQPTYAYLATQTNIQDETWRIDGVNNPGLPPPDSNSGNLLPGMVYT